ncbi:hypothetical protein EPUS_09021 [Endocarpon pusillum Z07020]|uniref:Uncharacterized protein n=1 Tax=Endocarpon pusillum (strain Z07020 / HMAS-L-300199) TaxID=1263415 RepID=U1FVV1_ENDPU|nr:uncharacterized protein EPUS_09021 [Endocarpon pusillum Z07020]ERF68967.1 hypothetical protein EPUS_09021 [Endocarpon pusillum Z07020]
MLTPILNWSTTVRKNNAGVIIKYWGMLMFTAMIAVLSKVLTLRVLPFMTSGSASCILDPKINCTIDEIIEPNGTYKATPEYGSKRMSLQYSEKCNCNSNCGSIDLFVPFRKSTNMQAYLVRDHITKILRKEEAYWVYLINILCLLAIIGQGIFGLVVGRWHPAVVRNWIFRLLSGAQERPRRSTFLWKCRYYISKITAGIIYMGAIGVAIISPLIFISSVILNEFIVHRYPEGERYDAVGQWSTWVGAGAVVLAAVIRQYHSAWVHSAELGLSTIIRIVKWIFGKAELRAEPARAERNKNNSAIEDLKGFFKQCMRPLKHVWRSMCNACHRIVLEWRDFKAWHKDPFERLQQPPMHKDIQTDSGGDVEPEFQDKKNSA